MKKLYRNYLSTKEKDRDVWAYNYVTQLPNYKAQLNISTDKMKEITKAYDTLVHAQEYQLAAADVAHARTVDKDNALWTPAGKTFTILPNTSKTGPVANESCTGGFFPVVIALNDELFAGDRLTDSIKNALKLNPLPKHELDGGADGAPNFRAEIHKQHLTLYIAKENFLYFRARIDHGTGKFDTEYTLHSSPFIDPHPLPKDKPQIWRVQLFGFFKDTPVTDEGIPSDIIDIAAKSAETGSEHSEGAV